MREFGGWDCGGSVVWGWCGVRGPRASFLWYTHHRRGKKGGSRGGGGVSRHKRGFHPTTEWVPNNDPCPARWFRLPGGPIARPCRIPDSRPKTNGPPLCCRRGKPTWLRGSVPVNHLDPLGAMV